MKTEIYTLPDECIINVSYPDNKGSHQITFSDLKIRFQEEDDHWFDNFVYNLCIHGYCYTNMGAKYVINK